MIEKTIKYHPDSSEFVKFLCEEIEILPDGRLDVKNASKLIGIKPKSLTVMAHRADMPPCVKISGKLYFYYNDIKKWLKSHKKNK